MRTGLALLHEAVGEELRRQLREFGSGLHAGLPGGTVEPPGGDLKQFGGGRQVPVGVTDMHIPEAGHQTGCPLLDIQALAVPPQQGADGESVPQIMQARAPADPTALAN